MLIVKSHLWQLAKYCGAESVLAAAFGRQPTILMYHRFSKAPEPRRVSAEQFDRQMAYLARHCHVVSWEEVIAGLRAGVSWRRNTVVVSIDDGYSDVYEVAFPILKKYRLPATVFATSGFVDRTFWHWADQLHYILTRTSERQLQVETTSGSLALRLDTPQAQGGSWNQLADLCYEADGKGRMQMVRSAARAARVELPEIAPDAYQSVTWAQLREMVAGGLNIGGHTATHPRLPQLTDAELAVEIIDSRRSLENMLQVPVTSFAYPFGTPADHDDRVARVVAQAGFGSACVAYFDRDLYRDGYALRRFGIGPDHWDFVKTIEGLKRARLVQKGIFQRLLAVP